MTDRPHAVVTGGAGFVGSHLVERLLADGYQVTTLDNYGSGRHDNLAHLGVGTPLAEIEHDVRQPVPSLDPVDEFYHFASRASPADFEGHAVEIARTNSEGSRHVYEAAREHGATVVLASTSEVYGDPEVNPQSESYRGNVSVRGPRAPYDESKRFAEALGVAYHQAHGLDIRTVRIFNTYGPRMRVDDGRVIPNFVSQALSGEDITVYGSGEQTRSFCYVTDLVDGVRRVAEAPAGLAANEVFNLGSADELSILTLAKLVRDLVDTSSEIVHHSRPEDDPEVRRPDLRRARSMLGWSPETDLQTGLGRTIDYFRRTLAD
jgi:UDP-glucuronate decarboxylase